jgi:hypothetical protein
MPATARLVCLTCLSACSACSRLETLHLFAVDAGSIDAATEAPLDGRLRPLVVNENTNLSNTSTGDRLCTNGGDAIAYAVVALGATTVRLTEAPSAGCLENGDEALLINLQGRPGSSDNVGNHELVRVLDVSADTVTLAQPKQQFYGESASDDNIGVERDTQRVILQRVPSYARLEVAEAKTLSAREWNGTSGGVLVMRIAGEVLVHGSIRMDGQGYRGGELTDPPESPGQQGESIEAVGTYSFARNIGGGGGGIADQTLQGCQQDGYPGGGGAHATAGTNAQTMDLCGGVGAGEGGAPYSNPNRLFLGSGGGSGGTDNVRVDNPPGGAGGAGGGIVWILADSIAGNGVISADGAAGVGDPAGYECDGSTRSCYDHSGPGGGGAGGTVRLTVQLLALGSVTATGGRGGNGNDTVAGNGGDGGNGLVFE